METYDSALIRERDGKLFVHVFNYKNPENHENILEPFNSYFPLQKYDVLFLGPVTIERNDSQVTISGQRHSWGYFSSFETKPFSEWMYVRKVVGPSLIDRIWEKISGVLAEEREISRGVSIYRESRGLETITYSINNTFIVSHQF